MSLGTLSVNDRSDGFLLDGSPWFWLADTCWSAFTNIPLDDWDYYLARRAEQGINVVQVNTLPQWDRCRPDLGIYPYDSVDGVNFDWSRPNPAYWERARQMCRTAAEHGIRPALVLVWCNYVPGTWGSAIAERTGAGVVPREEVARHVRRVVKELDEFDPVYVVTGDTDFKSEEAVAYYEDALATVHELAPQRLRCMHINRGNSTIPAQYLDRLDFYMFQPGHNYAEQFNAWRLPEAFLANPAYPKKPLINSEPCYEMMGASRHVYWRFSAQDCRASAWSSILAGASAGVTYGAHGIWNWQTSRSAGSALGEGFDAPFRWQECLQFEGAWDYGMIPVLLEALVGPEAHVEPAQDVLADDREAIRAARVVAHDGTTEGGAGKTVRYLAYLPRTTTLKLGVAPTVCKARAIDLDQKGVAHLPVTVDAAARTTTIAQHPFRADALVIVECAL